MNRSRTRLVTLGLLAILFVAATVVGGRLLKSPKPISLDQIVALSRSGNTLAGQGVIVETKHSAEMPETEPDVAGLFVQREDNRILVGTGMLSGTRLADGQWRTHHDGPVVEVVLSRRTVVYRDETLASLNGEAPAGEVNQILISSSLDEIGGTNTQIVAWGEKRGDRLLASVLIFIPST